MSRRFQVKKQIIAQSTIARPLITVPFENGFHFYAAIGNYTGISATNLREFAAKLKTVPLESVTFHFQRKDFEKWIRYALKDEALAERVSRIKTGQSAEELRTEILKNVETATLSTSQ